MYISREYQNPVGDTKRITWGAYSGVYILDKELEDETQTGMM